jgi:hypothetical protein
MQADEPLGAAARVRQLADRQRRGRRGQHGVVVQVLAQAREHVRLGPRVLDDRLDDERRVGEDGGVTADEHVAVHVRAHALAERPDLGVRLVAGPLGAREYGYVTLRGGDGRQSACDGPGSRDCQALRHKSPSG